ncbi:DUF6809 family protein [Lachnoclostridium edouardi]|uniref:DUF6809 family protein n=1 Tax=Lachnoclostridium edouardi TaxID=1926283 RepID=UPI000C7DFC06|nr:DUF6809 family protein [Lachnoclostridium edouardi]
MNFHETQMGQIFFNHQLPKLIQTLQEIAAGLSYRLPHMEWTADTDILHELYYGNYEPEPFGNKEFLTPQDQQVMEAESALASALPPTVAELFETYKTAVSIRDSVAAEQAYKAGFRLAVQLILSDHISSKTSKKEVSQHEPY